MVGDRLFAKDCSINYLKSFSNYVEELNAQRDAITANAEQGELVSRFLSDYFRL